MVFLFCKPSLQFKLKSVQSALSDLLTTSATHGTLQQLSFHCLGPKSYFKKQKIRKNVAPVQPAQLVSRYHLSGQQV